MIASASLTLTQALRIVPGVPFRILCLCRGSLATLVPAEVVGLDHASEWRTHWPTDFGGTAVSGEATDDDGDENSSRDNGNM